MKHKKNLYLAGDIECGWLSGPQAAIQTDRIWNDVDERVRRVILWDTPRKDREPTLYNVMSSADLVFLARDKRTSKYLAFSWIDCLVDTYVVHVCFCNGAEIPCVSERFFEDADKFYRRLICFFPRTFHHVLAFCNRHGFTKLFDTKTFLAGRGWVDGYVYARQSRRLVDDSTREA